MVDNDKKIAVVLGGSGFIGSNLVNDLKSKGFYVISADIVEPQIGAEPDLFLLEDLRLPKAAFRVIPKNADRVYQLAADVGGAGYIFSGEHDAEIINNSTLINLYAAQACASKKVKKVFFPSSSCVYPVSMQASAYGVALKETDVMPAHPDSVYGWEKLFAEQLWISYAVANPEMQVKIARYQNIYGPFAPYTGIRSKAPEAISWKVLSNPDVIEIWGDGKQTRSFIYINDCLDAMELLMQHPTFHGPVNIGNELDISINHMTQIIRRIVGSGAKIVHTDGLQGVRGKKSDNSLIEYELGWIPKYSMREGLAELIDWIAKKEGIEYEKN